MKAIQPTLWIFFASITLAFVGCTEEISPEPQDDDTTEIDDTGDQGDQDLTTTDFNILFVGNSLTYQNDLPELVRLVMLERGHNVGTRMVTEGNYALIDHWNEGKVQSEIERGLFDWVVVQQGPSSQAEGRSLLLDYGAKFKELCEANEARLAFYMVWPSQEYYHTFEGVIESYTDAATLNDAVLCPVGSIWKRYFDQTGNFDYYGPDGFHPSLKGSEVAAEVIVRSLLR